MHKMLKKLILIAVGLIAICLVLSKVYNISCTGVKTELALCDTVYDSINATGFVLRKETEIFNESKGIFNFVLNDGEKVQKGGVIAEVYEDEQAGICQKEIKSLDKEINTLETFEAASKTISTNPNYLEKQTYQTLKTFLSYINQEDYSELKDSREQLMYLLNERQVIFGDSQDFSERISELKKKREDLIQSKSKKVGNMIASESGYFVGDTDGFENAFNIKDILSVTPDKVNTLVNAKTTQTNAIAKIINLSHWYIACNISNDDAIKLKIGDFVDLALPFTDLDKVSAKVEAINQESKSSEASLILRCNYINKDILKLRKENIRIDFGTYSGIRIDKTAIHEKLCKKTIIDDDGNKSTVEKNVTGVYILSGKQLAFREIVMLYAGPNYAICAKNPNKESLFLDDTVHVYDEIVVGGSDLYDGKVIK
ncbi:MAG: hypothetical protein RUMPE_00855 [Eubacteriales bacterium SKADARSKE-1]|nr:hypothetical protein [Eubacteriales bacterium SKADARSKE-1]